MELVDDGTYPDERPVPKHKNYLIYCDESGIDGQNYYGFGSLWMPWERRGDFIAVIKAARERHHYTDEIKWTHVTARGRPFYQDLIEEFFRKNWLMFHGLVVRKAYSDRSFHVDFDQEKQKRFAMLLKQKIKQFSAGDSSKVYHVRVDPLPSRYAKADEAAFKIIGHTLRRDLGLAPLKTLITRNSREAPGIQLADLLIGAVMSQWQQKATAEPKLAIRKLIADHLGWEDLAADTHVTEWKFNIWYFHDPTANQKREVLTRALRLKVPMKRLKSQ